MKIWGMFVGVGTSLISAPAFAGLIPASVPVDSPWALGGLAVVIMVAGARLFRNRRK